MLDDEDESVPAWLYDDEHPDSYFMPINHLKLTDETTVRLNRHHIDKSLKQLYPGGCMPLAELYLKSSLLLASTTGHQGEQHLVLLGTGKWYYQEEW